MTKSKIAISIAAIFAVCLLSLPNIFAQTPPVKSQANANYEVILQTVIGSNNADNKTDVSQTLSGVIKKLKANYSYSNFRLSSTFLQRIADGGTIDFKTFLAGENSANKLLNTPSFLVWTLSRLESLPNAKGQNSIQFQSFRFGQQVPVETQTSKDENGKTNSVFDYEIVGLTLQKFSLIENAQTVIGSIPTSKPDELLFLILTVKSVDE